MKKGLKLEDFKKKIDDFANRTVQEKVKYVQGELYKVVYTQLLHYTPVLTSRARGNWYPSINTRITEFNKDDFALQGLGDFTMGDTDFTGAPNTALEDSRKEEINKKLQSMPLGQTIWIVNNAPYIRLLEDGRSQKAPAGMVKLAIQDGLNSLENKKLIKRR